MTEIRDGRDSDAEGLIALIGSVFDEYPGCLLDVDGEMPELLQIASWFREHGGGFWVAERDGRVVGSVGWTPASKPGGIELKKLYVSSSERRSGLGGKLVAKVEGAAAEQNARFIDLWSDTRFVTAHAFYEKRGWLRNGVTRELHDKSDTVEYYFRKSLTP
jgi:GNAT superfamily N-acetyltransferase